MRFIAGINLTGLYLLLYFKTRRKSDFDHIVTDELATDYYLNEEFLNSEVQLGDEG